MERASLSEKKYPKKFIAIAIISAMYKPFRPPNISPPASSKPLRIPSKRTLFRPFIKGGFLSQLLSPVIGWPARAKDARGAGEIPHFAPLAVELQLLLTCT